MTSMLARAHAGGYTLAASQERCFYRDRQHKTRFTGVSAETASGGLTGKVFLPRPPRIYVLACACAREGQPLPQWRR